MILKRPDHFEAGPVTYVRQPRIGMTAKVPLKDPAILRSIEEGAPRFQLADTLRRLARVKLRHPPAIYILAAAHRIREMHLPTVAFVDIGEGGSDPSFGHHRVGFAEKRFADYADRGARGRRRDGRAKSRAARADHQHVVFIGFVLAHQKSLQSVQMPIEHIRT
jgi:hypothetical protein